MGMDRKRGAISDLIRDAGHDLDAIAAASGVPVAQVYIAAQGGPLDARTCERIGGGIEALDAAVQAAEQGQAQPDAARFRDEVWFPVHDALARWLDAPDVAARGRDPAALAAADALGRIIDRRDAGAAAMSLILMAVIPPPCPDGHPVQSHGPDAP